jgi:hypothetical protein
VNCGYSAVKKAVQASTCALVDSEAGVIGYPTLHVGGEHDAVTVAVPGEDSERAHDWVQPAAVPITCGCDEVHVSGTLFRTIPLSVLGRELLPMMSIRVANTVWPDDDPLGTEKVVRVEPTAPSSRAMFWIGQVEKKSSRGAAVPLEFVICGCRNEVLLTPVAVAKMLVIPGTAAVAVA